MCPRVTYRLKSWYAQPETQKKSDTQVILQAGHEPRMRVIRVRSSGFELQRVSFQPRPFDMNTRALTTEERDLSKFQKL